jgi:hypothetical protein
MPRSAQLVDALREGHSFAMTMGANAPPGPPELVPWWGSVEMLITHGPVRERLLLALILFLAGMALHSLWWRVKRGQRARFREIAKLRRR